jgi:hypothetical protein
MNTRESPIGVAIAASYLANVLCVASDYHILVVASFVADRRVPKVAIWWFWIEINLVSGHCVFYRIHARPDPTKTSDDGDKNRSAKPAPDGAHVIPLCPIENFGVKAVGFRAALRSQTENWIVDLAASLRIAKTGLSLIAIRCIQAAGGNACS